MTTMTAPAIRRSSTAPGPTRHAHQQAPSPVPAHAGAICHHQLGGLPCANEQPHTGGGRGCVHLSTSGVQDRHDYGDDE